jgi:protein O-GlcNAc transferase
MSRTSTKVALAAAIRAFQSGQLPQAKLAFEQVLRLDPKEPDALHSLGLILFQLGEQEKGVELVVQSSKVRPKHPETHYNLGVMYQRLGQFDLAESSFRQVLAQKRDHAHAHFALGNALRELGKGDDAAKSFEQAVKIMPSWADGHFNLGNALRDLGEFQRAAACFQKAITLQPNWAEAHASLGQALRLLGQYEPAITSCRKALALNPNLPEGNFNLASALWDAGKRTEALISYRMAVILKPDWPEAHHDLGYSLFQLGRLEEAIATCRKTITLKPTWAEAHAALGAMLVRQGFTFKHSILLREADTCYREALALRPDWPDAHVILAGSPVRTGLDQEETFALLERAIALQSDGLIAHQSLLFNRQYSTALTPPKWRDALQTFAEACFAPLKIHISNPQNHKDPQKRLRIGYASPDFHNHSCAWFIEPVLATHDQTNFEIYCYSSLHQADDVTTRLKALSDHWYDVQEMSSEAVSDLIRSHSIDILVDLAGHTFGNILPVFRHKPAPVQVTWLGCPSSTGLEAIDYRLSDPWLTPEGTEEYFTEQIWNLERPSHCYRPPTKAPEIAPLPALKNGYLTFGSFNNLMKLSPETIALWAKMLRAVEQSHLVLKSWQLGDPEVCRQVCKSFAQQGIDEARLHLLSAVSGLSAHLNTYNQIDIALDTFPYNGATTTLEALWMGVPVLSLAGWRTASRYSLSFLSALELHELATDSQEQFVEVARNLSRNLPYLSELRGKLRSRMRNSSLCDEVGFTHHLEAAYRQMWQCYLRSK